MSAGTVFIGGICGVFIAMTVIYLSIKAIQWGVSQLPETVDSPKARPKRNKTVAGKGGKTNG